MKKLYLTAILCFSFMVAAIILGANLRAEELSIEEKYFKRQIEQGRLVPMELGAQIYNTTEDKADSMGVIIRYWGYPCDSIRKVYYDSRKTPAGFVVACNHGRYIYRIHNRYGEVAVRVEY